MFQFVILHDFSKESIEQYQEYAVSAWGKCHITLFGKITLLSSSIDLNHITSSTQAIIALAGYICHDQLGHRFDNRDADQKNMLQYILQHIITTNQPWPLNHEWSGSFSAVIFDETKERFGIFNDVIGWHPIYYGVFHNKVIIGTNLKIIGKIIGAPVDIVGLAERLVPPGANYGRRTLIQGVSRILPGEFLWVNLQGNIQERFFDNSLFDGIIKGDVHELAGEVWKSVRQEVLCAVGFRDQIHVGLSGGWDSRLIIAATEDMSDHVTAWTYGNEDEYEVIIAKNVAKISGADFELCPLAGQLFPSRAQMEEVISRTERVDYPMWFSVIQRLGNKNDELFLLGDHTESIVGRNIARYSSRAAKMNLPFLLGSTLDFTQSNYQRFLEWRENKINTIEKAIMGSINLIADPLLSTVNLKDLQENIRLDLMESATRIEAQMPYFTELFDELWTWLHYNRYYVLGQNRHVGFQTEAISPNLSFRFLRFISQVHPSMRVTRRLMDTIGLLPDLKKYGKIPTTNIPWFGNNFPAPFRNSIWAARSLTDQFLMRQLLAKKKPDKRQRVVKSTNFLQEYRNDDTIPNIRSWFSGTWINPEPFMLRANKRKNMESWPVAPMDIVFPANVSILLDLIY